MNTLKTIYDKLGDKTELAKHEVKLATILKVSEYKKYLELDKQKNKDFFNAIEKLKKDFYMLSGASLIIEMNIEDFTKKVEELGLSPNVSTEYKESKKILEEMRKEEKFFGDRKRKHNLGDA